MDKFIIIILIIILLLILLCNNNENFNISKEIKEEIDKEEIKNINMEIINLLSNENLIIETLMIQNILLKLGLKSKIIYNLDETNYKEDNFYIIIYPNNRIIPKNYIFWQINDLSIDDLYTNKHFINLLDLPETFGSELLDAIKKVAEKRFRERAEGFNIIVNNGGAAGQAVMHSHLHLIPRKKRDNVRFKTI